MTAPGSILLDAVARRRGRSAEVTLTADIPAGTHIEPHLPPEPTLIPTVVEVEGLEEAVVDYPEPVRKDLGFSDVALSVYEGTIRFVIRGEVAPGVEVVKGTVSYQPCVGGACLPPRASTWEAKLAGERIDRDSLERDSRGEPGVFPGKEPPSAARGVHGPFPLLAQRRSAPT